MNKYCLAFAGCFLFFSWSNAATISVLWAPNSSDYGLFSFFEEDASGHSQSLNTGYLSLGAVESLQQVDGVWSYGKKPLLPAVYTDIQSAFIQGEKQLVNGADLDCSPSDRNWNMSEECSSIFTFTATQNLSFSLPSSLVCLMMDNRSSSSVVPDQFCMIVFCDNSGNYLQWSDLSYPLDSTDLYLGNMISDDLGNEYKAECIIGTVDGTNITMANATVIPEASTSILCITALFAFAARRRRREFGR